MDFTKDQERAINDNYDGNVLVSASAGSGKTRVLVQRVIRKIESGISIDNLLIVTFTRAAAKEMRDRIQSALREKLNQNINNAQKDFLIRQLRKLPVANISTLDSFCQRIVQHYYYVINLDPNFRLLNDQTEVSMLRDNVWDNVREDLYANDSDGMFARLTENFSNDRSDEGLTDLVYNLYDYANVNENPKQWLKGLTKLYQVRTPLVNSNFYQNYLKPVIINQIKLYQKQFQSAYKIAERESLDRESSYLRNDLDQFDNLLHQLSNASWNDLVNEYQKGIKFETFRRLPKSDPNYNESYLELHERLKNQRNNAKKGLNKYLSQTFIMDERTALSDMHQAKRLLIKLIQVVHQFSHAYQAVKEQRHALEFIDIEHAALDILKQNPARSETNPIRTILQNQFDEIMIDEYQDNNHLQDAILSIISKKDEKGHSNNMFMVGDVKQSIYRFRLAAPQMFNERLKTYQRRDNNDQNITLAENFRSASNIDYFVNLIFDQIMSNQIGDVDYNQNTDLKVGAKYPNELNSNIELMLYDNNKQDEKESPNYIQDDSKTLNSDESISIEDNAHGQIEMVAQKIQNLLDRDVQVYDSNLDQMRSIRYSDIGILASTRNNNLIISDIFDQHNIPVTINDAQSYFKTTEIQIMMSLLEIIDNPYQDIPLVSVLRSPIVGLDENQLAYLRINSKQSDYYESLLRFFDHYGENETTEFSDNLYHLIKIFLGQLKEFRDVAQQHPLVDLIWHIYQRTGFLDYVGGMPAGKQRQANLHALYDRAAEYEQTSFRGLFQFVRFVRRMQEKNDDLAEAETHHDEDTVSVMTIHGSKGLEFPIVFLIDATHGFNFSDTKSKYILNDDLKIGIDYFNTNTRIKKPTLPKLVVQDYEKRSNLSEEMRKLYVALTRAEQHLFITGVVPKGRGYKKKQNNQRDELIQNWKTVANDSNTLLNVAMLGNANNYLDWIGPALIRHSKFNDETDVPSRINNNPTDFSIKFYGDKDLLNNIPLGNLKEDENWLHDFHNNVKKNQNLNGKYDDQKWIHQIMNFKYPNHESTITTAYQSVSEIKRLFDDPDNDQMGLLNSEGKTSSRYMNQDFAKPKFLQDVSRPKSSEVGTATHLVLQLIDIYKKPVLDDVNDVINRLVADQVITKQVADLIDRSSILSFFDTKLGQLILKNPNQFYRESPFSLLMSANKLFKGFSDNQGEKVLIHGIIDGYLVLDDKVIIVDYKTDYVNTRQLNSSINKLISRYRGQVNVYSLALSDILNRPVQNKYLYSLRLKRLINLNDKRFE